MIMGFFTDEQTLKESKDWNSFTEKNTFSKAKRKGEIAVLTAVASLSTREKEEEPEINIENINPSKEEIEAYIATNKDPIVRFHKKAKAGFEKGAEVRRIIPKGNILDKESLGTIVIFEYPNLHTLKKPQYTSDRIGLSLVETAIKFAKERKKERVVALSRLGEFYKQYKGKPQII